MSKLLLGCDPELFLQDAAGALHSAIGLIGGSKDFPRPLFDLGDGFAVQEDNVAMEFNAPPAGDKDSWVKNVGDTVAYLEQQVQERYGLSVSRLSAALFPEQELDNPKALEFGCDPDFDAWTGKVNPKPEASDKRLRSCGGHVHFGFDFQNADRFMEECHRVGRFADLYLGVPSVLVDHGEERKQLYGKRGAIRYKPYGMEYRVLSNFWVFDANKRGWVYDNAQLAYTLSLTKFDIDSLEPHITQAINDNNKDMARGLIEAYNIPMPV